MIQMVIYNKGRVESIQPAEGEGLYTHSKWIVDDLEKVKQRLKGEGVDVTEILRFQGLPFDLSVDVPPLR